MSYHKKAASLSPALIIVGVEGSKREKQYFEWFNQEYKDSRIKIVVLEPKEEYDLEGNLIDDPSRSAPHWSLKRLERYFERVKISSKDQIWLVFDEEHFKSYKEAEEFKEQIKKSDFNTNLCELVISNPCFEIWLALHVTDLPTDKKWEDCKEVKQWLAARTVGGFAAKYLHENTIKQAIQRAIEIDKTPNSIIPARPGTRIYHLAQELLNAVKKY